GLRAHADDAAVAQPEALGRQSRHLVHGLGQPEEALRPGVLAEHARERAVAARVRLARAEDAVGRQRRAVGADHDRWMGEGAAEMSASAPATLPQFGRPAALMWLTWTDSSPSRPTRIASPTASRSVAPSPRIWLA